MPTTRSGSMGTRSGASWARAATSASPSGGGEYALGGGRINTDFIDNSAGVDTSDREVNLKVLMGLAIERGALTFDERNELLESATDDVVRRVLYDNYLQARSLSQEVAVAAERNEACEDLMLQLEAEGELDRAVEFLPTSDEMAERRGRGEGLTRPELALLVAYSKRSIKETCSTPTSRTRRTSSGIWPTTSRSGSRSGSTPC